MRIFVPFLVWVFGEGGWGRGGLICLGGVCFVRVALGVLLFWGLLDVYGGSIQTTSTS